MTYTITDTNAEQLIQQHPVVVIDCWAPWCGPCQQIGPIIDELAKEFDKKALIGKLNIDVNPDFLEKHNIKSIPTLLFFKNGIKQDQMVGLHTLQALTTKVNDLLAG